MISENDRKYLALINNLINLCLKKTDNLYFIRSTFAEIIRIYENLEDKALQTILQNRSKEILIAKDQSKIKKYLEEILKAIEDKESEIEKTYIDLGETKVDSSDRYRDDCIKYKDKNIKDVEEKILNSPVYQEKLHEPLKNKYWGKNCQHARLSDNLRIIYSYIPKKKFKFEAIVTHNELDKN